MSEDKKVIFSMVRVNKTTPTGKHILKDIYLSFFYGAKIGIIGNNGAGKSTALNGVAASLRRMGHSVVTTREPGGSPLAEQIRECMLG
ncbi:MAG: ATP-binding cassette domain-containing protein, partial [Flavobacteriales bacterium]